MKKTFSIFLSLLLAISCLSVGSINAFANTKKTAQEIYLNSSAAVWGDLGNKAYVEFTPSYTGSFEFYCFNQSYGGNIMASIEDFSGETYNTVLNDNNPNLICAATLEAGKTYYYVLESASVSFSNVVSVRNHNHDFSLYKSYPAHYDQYDSAQNYDGYVESICTYCPEYIKNASFPAVSSVKAKTKSFTYNKKKKTTSVTVYDRMGNVVSPSNYTVSYKNNTKPGYLTLTVKFKGNYSGTAIIRLTIKPKKETLSSLKSTKKKKMTVKWKKDKTVTGYQIQYSTSRKYAKKSTKTVTISKKSTTSKTISKLKSKKKYYVRIRAYKKSSGKKIYGAWSKTKTVKVK